ncbi:NAD(P)H-dependent oxidoreductase subunit E [Niveibacterium sp. 24ML]|uniref:NAD(P)H-dependent oxidoreductase subunit E n=1 Tax=Niveibacterium sp. 24ML TaxID=2985512 RepID=UPI00226F60A9|nr:NAD(P)H-dependent oxidoreductase subunit E [Niveibacterium sp. 24ML]MCX9156633.1 NAD(P)H-dependent oxidoreductase subunit E [Niveibacterium sp. 24ML]
MPQSSSLERVLTRISARYRDEPYQLLQMLRAVQASYSHVPQSAMQFLARHLGVPLSQVQGVVEFYAFLHETPRGRYDVRFSDNITDQMLGSRGLCERLCQHLELTPGQPRADGKVTVDYTSCTGMSDQGPAALVNGLAVTRLDVGRIDEMADLIDAGIALEAWPRDWFAVRDHIRRSGPMLDLQMAPGAALEAAVARGASSTLAELARSGLRGRGGAGYLTAHKWRFCLEAPGMERFIVCNADEGEPGTFKDRVLLTRYADALFEGMALAGFVVGAREGFLYLRGEYEYLLPHLESVLERRREEGLLGGNLLGSRVGFDISIHLGAGAYICGEESALIESLEGKRGQARVRPPFPAIRGYADKPTVVNNVQTFIQAAQISAMGSAWFAEQGTEKSRGTVLLSISGDVARRGVYEYPFGVTVKEVLADCGAGAVQAIQIGGPSGHLIGAADFERRIAFEDLPTTGSLMVFDWSRDVVGVVQNFSRFFQHESCGFCTPCRVGTTVLRQLIDKVASGHASAADLDELEACGMVTRSLSHCGLGQTAPNPVLDGLKRFRPVLEAKLLGGTDGPGFDLDAELSEARKISDESLKEGQHG